MVIINYRNKLGRIGQRLLRREIAQVLRRQCRERVALAVKPKGIDQNIKSVTQNNIIVPVFQNNDDCADLLRPLQIDEVRAAHIAPANRALTTLVYI